MLLKQFSKSLRKHDTYHDGIYQHSYKTDTNHSIYSTNADVLDCFGRRESPFGMILCFFKFDISDFDVLDIFNLLKYTGKYPFKTIESSF